MGKDKQVFISIGFFAGMFIGMFLVSVVGLAACEAMGGTCPAPTWVKGVAFFFIMTCGAIGAHIADKR